MAGLRAAQLDHPIRCPGGEQGGQIHSQLREPGVVRLTPGVLSGGLLGGLPGIQQGLASGGIPTGGLRGEALLQLPARERGAVLKGLLLLAPPPPGTPQRALLLEILQLLRLLLGGLLQLQPGAGLGGLLVHLLERRGRAVAAVDDIVDPVAALAGPLDELLVGRQRVELIAALLELIEGVPADNAMAYKWSDIAGAKR